MAEIYFPDGSKLSDLLKLTGGTLTGTLNSRDVIPTTTDTYSLGSDTYWFYGTYTKFLKIDDTGTSIDNSTGNMKFTVASGKKFEFVVSA